MDNYCFLFPYVLYIFSKNHICNYNVITNRIDERKYLLYKNQQYDQRITVTS